MNWKDGRGQERQVVDQVCVKTPHELTWARYLYIGSRFVISLAVGLQPSGASQVKLRIGPWNMRSRERWEKRGRPRQIGRIGRWQFL